MIVYSSSNNKNLSSNRFCYQKHIPGFRLINSENTKYIIKQLFSYGSYTVAVKVVEKETSKSPNHWQHWTLRHQARAKGIEPKYMSMII